MRLANTQKRLKYTMAFSYLDTYEKYKEKLIYVVTHSVTKNYLILFSGRGIGACIGFVVGILLPRYLSPFDYGVYAMVMAIFDISVVFAELGLGTAIVRFVSLYINQDKQKAHYYLMLSFWILAISGLLVSIVGVSLSDVFAEWFYFKPGLSIYIKLGFCSVLGSVLWSYALSSLQAREFFTKYSIASVGAGLLKLVLILGIIFFLSLTVSSVLIVQIIVPVVGSWVVLHYTSTRVLGVKGDFRGTMDRLLHFGKWTFIVDLSVMAFSRVDTLILGRYTGEVVIGNYNVAVTLLYPFTVLISSFLNVLFPRVSRLSKISELKRYAKRVVLINVVCVFCFLPVVYFAGDIIRFLFSKPGGAFEYSSSILMFQIMFFGFMFNFVVEPIYLISYAIDKPSIIAYLCLFKLFICLTANFILVPVYHGIGAATSSVITHVLGGSFALYLIYKNILKEGDCS